ncbi:MAG: PAS domain S-box protein [Chitinivibrionales bacterium]|nr:PAS domain S-box protein [Chitinivibrionales bacterium]
MLHDKTYRTATVHQDNNQNNTPDMSPLGNSSTVTDEIQLLMSDEILQNIFNSVGDGIVIADVETKQFLRCNSAFCAMLGYDNQETTSIGIRDIHPKEEMDRIRELFHLLGEKKITVASDIPVKRKDGSIISCDINGSVMTLAGRSCLIGTFHDITKDKLAVQKEKQLMVRWQTTFDSVSDAICILDIDHHIVQSNRKMKELFPTIDQNMGTVHCWELIHGTAESLENCPVRRLMTSLKRESMELIIKGTCYEVVVDPIFNHEKTLVGIVHSIRDINIQKKNLDALRTAKEYAENLIRTANTMVVGLDINGNITVFNRAAEEITGYTFDDLRNRSWFEVLVPRDRFPAVWEIFEKTSSGSLPKNFENPILTKEGNLRHIVWQNNEVWENGVIVGTISFGMDITERKQSERLLFTEKERLAVTLRSIGDGVIATDRDKRIVVMNRVAEELTGWSQNDACGKPLTTVFTIFSEITRIPIENPIDKVLLMSETIELANHTILVSATGVERVITDSAAPILDDTGSTIGVVLVFRDMTEKQHLIQAAQKSQKLESLGILAGGIAHDFNNLLGGIYGYIDVALGEVGNDGISPLLKKALLTIDRARGLTQQLLTFAKGGAPIRKIDSLTPFIQETVTFTLSGSNVSCDFLIAEDLWKCEYDRSQIAQVIENVVINAVQAMPLGGNIIVSASNVVTAAKKELSLKPGTYIKISIKDCGIGIPKEILHQIFDPFFTTKTKGHGLGLALCYSIVRRHNGAIDVESEPGKGSTFHLYLPASINAETGESSASSSGHNEPFRGSGKILVMDDEGVIRDSLFHMLESIGYTAVLCSNGSEALALVEQTENIESPFVAYILDLTVPGGRGGIEIARALRTKKIQVPIIVASGYANDPVMAQPREYGFTDSIRKPFCKSELVALLKKYCTPSR